ncbi:MAG: polyhydroxyalkanoic acid system family protein [Planctomycetia bacterium]
MKAVEVRVPHSLGREEVRRRLDAALVRARDEFGDKIGELDATWDGEDRLRLLLTVMGMQIDSEVEIQPAELLVKLQIPGMAGLFAGKIKQGIEERLGGLLGSHQV